MLTNKHQQTNMPGVFAGDCAEAVDKVSGKNMVNAIQPNSAGQARITVTNVVTYARGKPAHADLNDVTHINVLDTLGLISGSFGDWQGPRGCNHLEQTNNTSGRHLSLCFQEDVTMGRNVVGWADHIGAMRGLIES
ncbi:MAG: hypothetical protein A2503_04040 [Burkholderiales bacterium RIFOXYD12_FULL_59_19]|nr:MAG: hypothetical protein A2503_04040 [Burkholderiales bacterium RIFOXYD12_FULL_59_19]